MATEGQEMADRVQEEKRSALMLGIYTQAAAIAATQEAGPTEEFKKRLTFLMLQSSIAASMVYPKVEEETDETGQRDCDCCPDRNRRSQ